MTSTAPTPAHTRPPRSALRTLIGLAAILLGFCVVIPIVIIGVAGKSMETAFAPRFANTSERLGRAQVLRPYRAPLDSTITPLQAGEAFVSLGARAGDAPRPHTRPSTLTPITLPHADTSLFRGAGASAWVGPGTQHLIELAHKGFSRAESDYLASLDSNHVWAAYSTVARAPRMDLAGGMYVIPFAADASPFELPIPRFAGTKEIAYAAVARAAWHVAAGRNADAERVLREVISNGFRLVDDGNTLVDALIGVVIVGIGRDALVQLYSVTKNPEGDRLTSALAAFDATHKTTIAGPVHVADMMQIVGDSGGLRSLRFEMTVALSLSPCTSARTLLFGPPAEIAATMAAARTQLVRTPAEGALYDLDVLALDRAGAFARREISGPGPRALIAMARIPAFLLHNSRISNCMALLVSGIAT